MHEERLAYSLNISPTTVERDTGIDTGISCERAVHTPHRYESKLR